MEDRDAVSRREGKVDAHDPTVIHFHALAVNPPPLLPMIWKRLRAREAVPPEHVFTGPVFRMLVAERVELIDQNATMLIKGLLRDVLRLGTGRCNVVRNR